MVQNLYLFDWFVIAHNNSTFFCCICILNKTLNLVTKTVRTSKFEYNFFQIYQIKVGHIWICYQGRYNSMSSDWQSVFLGKTVTKFMLHVLSRCVQPLCTLLVPLGLGNECESEDEEKGSQNKILEGRCWQSVRHCYPQSNNEILFMASRSLALAASSILIYV